MNLAFSLLYREEGGTSVVEHYGRAKIYRRLKYAEKGKTLHFRAFLGKIRLQNLFRLFIEKESFWVLKK